VKNHLLSAKNVLIVLPTTINVDILAAGLALAHTLRKERKITFASAQPIHDAFKQFFRLDDFTFIDRFKKKEVVLSLNRKKGTIKAVRWREVDGKVQFIITPDDGTFEFDDIDLETTGESYDLIITLACKSLKDTQLYTDESTIWEKTLINIDIHTDNTQFGTVNKVKKQLSLSSYVFDLLRKEDIALTKEVAKVLLQGILWSNGGFRKSENLKRAVKAFEQVDGNVITAIAQIFDTLTIAELRYIGKMIANMHIIDTDIIISKIKHPDMQDVQIERIFYPEINLISRVQNHKIAIILSEQKKDIIYARIYSHDGAINVFEIFSDFTPLGNARRVHFIFDGTLDDLEKRLLDTIRTYRTGPQDQQEEEQKEDEEKEENAEEEEKEKSSEGEPLQKAEKLPQAIPVENDSPPMMYPTAHGAYPHAIPPTTPLPPA